MHESLKKENRFWAWGNIWFVVLSSIGTLIWFPYYLVNYENKSGLLLLVSLIYLIFSIFSISAGYHRYYSHKSFEASKLLQWFFICVGASVWQGPLANWMSEHKLHHAYPESEKDPYPIKHGFWWAYLGWIFYRKQPLLIPEVVSDPLIMWQFKYYKPIAFLFSFGLGALLGFWLGTWWEGVLLIGIVRTFYVQHATFLINTWGHSWGYSINDSLTAKNHHLLAWLTLGEGYHNNHHAKPQYFTTSFKPYEFDGTKYFILACEKLQLASKLKNPYVEKKLS